jgi:DNA-binding transcriptional regulator YiaG
MPGQILFGQLGTLCNHLRKRRVDIDLDQEAVSRRLAVDTCTVTNWESGDACPALRWTPSIRRA